MRDLVRQLRETIEDRRVPLLEQVDLVRQFKELKRKAKELDVDLPSVLKQQEIEWPKDEGDLIRNQSRWFPIMRRSLPQVTGVLKNLSKELAWQHEEKPRE